MKGLPFGAWEAMGHPFFHFGEVACAWDLPVAPGMALRLSAF